MNINDTIKKELGLCGLADAYKPTHALQYPPGTTEVCVYMEARNSKVYDLKGSEQDLVIFFGMQIFLDQYMTQRITAKQVEAAKEFWADVGVYFPYDEFMIIANELDGWLPLEIRALPEGLGANIHTALYTIKNTDPRFFWLPAFIETIIQQNIWYPTTVATLSWTVKLMLLGVHDKTSTAPIDILDYKLHDFGFRGVSSLEHAAIGGAAHAVNFKGSDTSVCNVLADKVYNCKKTTGDVATHSIAAMEHMTATAWSRKGETDAIRNFIETYCCDGGMGSVIADQYDIYNFVENIIGQELYDLITGKVAESGGCVIVRPDSGDPTLVPLQVLKLLGGIFGYEENEKGYKVLPPYIRVIQGDGMNVHSISQLFQRLVIEGWAIDNIAVGMGAGLLQKINRDTLSMAQKGSQITVDGKTYGISKDPITDPGKKSQEGEFSVTFKDGKAINVPRGSVSPAEDLLNVVYRDGKVFNNRDFAMVRERANDSLHTFYGYIKEEVMGIKPEPEYEPEDELA